MTDRSLAQRDAPVSVFTPAIPTAFVHPGLSLPQVLSIFWAHRKWIVLIGAAVLSLAALALTLWPRTYTATVTLMVNYEVNDPVNGKELPSGQLGSYIATQLELMQTPEVLLAVVDRLDLIHRDEYTRGYRGIGTVREWAATTLRKELAIYQGGGGSQLIYVSAAAHDPEGAAQIANTVAEVYEEQDFLRVTNPKIHTAQLNELKAKVDRAQQTVADFHQRNSLIEDTGKGDVDVVMLATLESRLLEASNARGLAASRAARDPAASDQVLSSELVQKLKTQLADQEFELAQHKKLYTPRHPALQYLEAQVADTRHTLASVTRSYAANAAGALVAAQQLEETLQTAVADQRARVLTQGQLRATAAKYQLELESSETVYKRALEDYDQIHSVLAGHYRNVSFISRAIAPAVATKPNILRGLLLSFAAAGILAFGLPLGYELFNRRVRCRDDIERQYGIPVLVEFARLPNRSRA